MALVCVRVWTTRAQSSRRPAQERSTARSKSVEVFGKVVDAETGKPVEAFVTQAGKFDPKDPKNVTWGFSEAQYVGCFQRDDQVGRRLDAILADGYVPQPVLSEAPPPEKTESRR